MPIEAAATVGVPSEPWPQPCRLQGPWLVQPHAGPAVQAAQEEGGGASLCPLLPLPAPLEPSSLCPDRLPHADLWLPAAHITA